MNNPLISIIIPIYNVEEFLPQCLDSAIKQTYSNLEIILINDGSTDNSEAICLEFAKMDNRIVYHSRKNHGASASRNFGMDICKGDYIFFLDSDDYISCDCIDNLIQHTKRGKFAIAGYYIDDSNERSIIKANQSFGVYESVSSFMNDFYKYFATKTNFIWGRLFDAKILSEYNIRFDPSIALGEDLLFNIEYYRHCRSGFDLVEHCGYYYRQHGTSTLSKKFDPRMFEWNNRCYNSIRDFLVETNTLSDINKRHLYRNILGNLIYSFELLCNAPNFTFIEKAKMLKQYSREKINRQAMENTEGLGFRGRVSCKLLKSGLCNIYVLKEVLLTYLRRIKHAYL